MNLEVGMSRTVTATLSSLVLCLAADAADYTWSNEAAGVESWQTLSNWSSDGTAATDLPTNASDTVSFPAVDGVRRQVNVIGADGPVGLAAIRGEACWRLCLNAYGDMFGGRIGEFSVADVEDFAGEWQATGSKKTLALTAASGVQTLRLVQIDQQFALRVANAATTVDVLQVRGTAGSLKKSGAGDLRIREVAEAGNLVLELEEGNVQLDGVRKESLADDADVFGKAVVHLDASAEDTWRDGSYADGDGRVRVVQWRDVRGNGVAAEVWDNSKDPTASHLKTIEPPFISATRSSTGLPLMDFGARTADAIGTYGPQAVMRLRSRIAKAQEVFFVSALNDGTMVVGDSSDVSFAASDAYVFTDGAGVLKDGGFARFNGNRGWQDLTANGGFQRMRRTFDSYTADKGDLMLTNVRFGDGNAKPIFYLASDRLYASAGNGSGGVRIGELLVFPEALTEDERRDVTDYLMRKWFAKADRKDFHLVNAADGTSISVPEGRVARVDTLRVMGTTFTKKGTGTLQIGRVYPEDLTITVAGGDVKLDAAVASQMVTEPVGTPQFWLDADADAGVSFVKSGEDVTNWRDCRGNGTGAARLDFAEITAYPQVDAEALPGRSVLNFPAGSALELPSGGQRESFVVFSFPDNVRDYNVLANGYPTDRSGGGVSAVFAKYDVGPDAMGGGVYSVDGRPVRPFEATGTTFVQGQWHVAHLSTTIPYDLCRIASDGPRRNTGHVKIAEIVTYDVALTSDERRQNIDYLMRKWLGRRHPECEPPSRGVTVAFAGDATVAGDADVTYAAVSGAGRLVKTGPGSIAVTAELPESFMDLAVEGGALTVVKPAEMPDRSQFHFDAMDEGSFAAGSYMDAEGERRVLTWLDVRRNGIVAATKPMEAGLYVTNPVVRQIICPDGVTRPIFDFLVQSGRDVNPPTAAALSVSPVPSLSREAVCVYADTVEDSSTVDVFGTTESNVTYFKRGLSGSLFREDLADADVQGGYIWVDGVMGSSATKVTGAPNNLHVVHIAPANGKAFPMGAIGSQGSNYAGGQRYGEYLAFAEPLNDKERTYLNGYLMHKWLGQGEAPVWTNELTSVRVAKGARLTVSGGVILAPTLSGAGTVEASRVMGISALNLTASDRWTVEGLTVMGVADFAPSVAVTLIGAEAAVLRPGRYVLLTATAFVGLDLSKWTLAPAQKRAHRFVREGNAILLEVRQSGMCVIVR